MMFSSVGSIIFPFTLMPTPLTSLFIHARDNMPMAVSLKATFVCSSLLEPEMRSAPLALAFSSPKT